METDNNEIVFHDDIDSNEIQISTSENLSIEDWSDIEHIQLIYSSIFENENLSYVKFDTSDRISALISWSEFASQKALKLIDFFKQIDEFEKLNSDDRFILIKYNLLPLYLLQKCLRFNLLTGTFVNIKDEDRLKRRQFFRLCSGTSGIRESFLNLMKSLSIVTEQDSILINLLLIILLFSKGLSMNEDEPLLNDMLTVNQAQSHYIKLTWNYLIYKKGQEKTTKQFIKLLTEISRIQSTTRQFKEFFRLEFQSTDTLDRLAPLMYAVLNIA